MAMSNLQAQEHLSHFFDLEAEIPLPEWEPAGAHWVGCYDNGIVCFCPCNVDKMKKKGYVLSLHLVDVSTRMYQTVEIVLPENKQAAFWNHPYWIYNIFIDDEALLITTQQQIFEYERHDGNRFMFKRTLPVENGDFAFQSEGTVVGISQINDVGFAIHHYQSDGSIDTTIQLPLPAPFLLQFSPNGLLKYHDGFLFALPTPHPILQKIDLVGNLVGTTHLQFPEWVQMPEAYIAETASLPYGPDRAMLLFNSSAEYSFPLEVFPFHAQTALLAYHQYNEERRKFEIRLKMLQTAADGTLLRAIPVSTYFQQEQTIKEYEYPVYYADRALIFTFSSGDRWIQLVKEADFPYTGMTGLEYRQAKESYFSAHDPVVRLRVLKLKTDDDVHENP